MNLIIIIIQEVPPTLSLLGFPEVSCFRQLLGHLSPHLSVLAKSSFQFGSKVIARLGEGIRLTRCQSYMVQHALWARNLLQAHVTSPVSGDAFIWREKEKSCPCLCPSSTCLKPSFLTGDHGVVELSWRHLTVKLVLSWAEVQEVLCYFWAFCHKAVLFPAGPTTLYNQLTPLKDK